MPQLVSLRIGNIPEDMNTQSIYDDFAAFGKIGDFYRPSNLQRGKPSRFAFVRYFSKEDADNASMAMHGKRYGENVITVHDANMQNSYFTQDTGFITNQLFDTPKVAETDFDSTMPPAHYPTKRKEELKQLDVQYTLRIDDLPPEISKEQLEEIFSEFGEVCSIYYPMDLKRRQPRGFAFVRYGHEATAELAAQNMHDTNLGCGRNIQVSMINSKTYWKQDESGTVDIGHFV
mmetsp:Transcript_2710/g.4203  ORF Transcript_2710/g.4203 Transcript_2710/m.4203 type:complete len:232 (-) Transcript_2710:123-818(-)